MKDRAYSHRTRGLARYGFLIVLAFALAACDGGAMAPSLGDPVVLPSAAVSPTASPSPTTSTTPTPTPSTTPTATEVPPNSVPVTNPEPWPAGPVVEEPAYVGSGAVEISHPTIAPAGEYDDDDDYYDYYDDDDDDDDDDD